jgi:hypothetical protein
MSQQSLAKARMTVIDDDVDVEEVKPELVAAG